MKEGLFRHRPLGACCCAFSAAVAAAELAGIGYSAIAVLLPLFVLLFVLWMILKRKRTGKALLCGALCVLCAAAGLFCHYFKIERSDALLLSYTEPQIVEAVVTDELYTNYEGTVLELKIRSVNGKKTKGCAAFTNGGTPLHRGDVISTVLLFITPEDGDGFSERSYLRGKGITLLAVAEEDTAITVIGRSRAPSVLAAELADFISDRIFRAANGMDEGLCAALLVGDRSEVDPIISLDMKRAGTLHLLAISGMHFTVLMGVLDLLLRRTRMHKTPRLVFLFVFALIYSAITGFSYPVMRACIMLFAVYAAYFAGRERDIYTALFLSVALILGADPCAAHSCGLWLSAFATFGMVFGTELTEGLRNTLHKRNALLGLLFTLLVLPLFVGLCAVLCSMPVMWITFGEMSLLSPIATLICEPMFNALLFASLIMAAVGTPIPLFTAGVSLISHLIVSATTFFSDLGTPYSLNYPFVPYLATAFVLFAALAVICGKRSRRVFLALVLAVLASFPICTANAERSEDAVLCTVTHSYGKNDMLLISRDDRTVLFDMANGYSKAVSSAKGCMNEVYATEIDLLVITRRNTAALRMIVRLGTTVRVKRVLCPAPVTEEDEELELLFMDAADYIRAQYGTYGFGSAIEHEGTEFTVFSSMTEDSAVPVRAITASAGNARIMYLSSGASHSPDVEKYRALAKNAQLVILGASGPKNKLPMHLVSNAATVLPYPEYMNELSVPYMERLKNAEVSYNAVPLRADVPVDQ